MGLKNAENTKLPYSNVPWSERSGWLWIGCHASAHKPFFNKTRLQRRFLFTYLWWKAKAWHSDSNEHVGNVNKSNSEATQQDPTTDSPDLQNIRPSSDAQHCIHNAGPTTTSTSHDHDCIHNAELTTTSTAHDHDCIHNAGPTTTSCPWPRSFWQCAPLKQHLFRACKEKTIAR